MDPHAAVDTLTSADECFRTGHAGDSRHTLRAGAGQRESQLISKVVHGHKGAKLIVRILQRIVVN